MSTSDESCVLCGDGDACVFHLAPFMSGIYGSKTYDMRRIIRLSGDDVPNGWVCDSCVTAMILAGKAEPYDLDAWRRMSSAAVKIAFISGAEKLREAIADPEFSASDLRSLMAPDGFSSGAFSLTSSHEHPDPERVGAAHLAALMVSGNPADEGRISAAAEDYAERLTSWVAQEREILDLLSEELKDESDA